MESAVEQRLNVLEARVKTLESLLGLDAAPVPAPAAPPRPSPPASQMWPEPPTAARPQAASRDLEEILGSRVLGWVGGVAVTIAAIFFVVMAVRNGWIGEAAHQIGHLGAAHAIRIESF